MIGFGIAALALGLAVLALAWRGRVIARGRFCRRCRFDLGGLDPSAACPECGRDVTTPGATRPTRRTPSRVGLAAGCLLLLAGGAVTALATVRGPAFFASLPDGQILLLNRLGVDGALDELAARATRTPSMSDAHWRVAVTRGLAHQADLDTPWDPRWGEVLGRALVSGRMSEEQIRQYLAHGLATEFVLRDRVMPDAKEVTYLITVTRPRVTTSGKGGPIATAYKTYVSAGFAGVVGHAQSRHDTGASMWSTFEIPSTDWVGSGSLMSAFRVPADALKTGSARVYMEPIVKLIDQDGAALAEAGLPRVERTVRVVPPGESLVRVVSDPEGAAAARRAMRLSEFGIILPGEASGEAAGAEGAAARRAKRPLGHVSVSFQGARPAVAGRLFLVTDAGEVEFTTLVMAGGADQHSIGLRGMVEGDEETVIRVARELHARGVVDLVFRTDPSVAERDPRIDEIVDVTLIFRAAPVRMDGPVDVPAEAMPADGAPDAAGHGG